MSICQSKKRNLKIPAGNAFSLLTVTLMGDPREADLRRGASAKQRVRPCSATLDIGMCV